MSKKCVVVVVVLVLVSQLFGQGESLNREHDLLLMPTAFTMEKGQSYLTNYEVAFLNYTYAVTNTTHLALFSLFPVTKDFTETISIGAKQNLITETKVGVSVFSAYQFKLNAFIGGIVQSLEFAKNSSLHIAYGLASDFDNGEQESILMIGVKFERSKRTAFIMEYTVTSLLQDMDEPEDDPLNPDKFITIGWRFRSNRLSFEVGGIRPLEEIESLLFLPFLKGTVYFGR
ncbi:MAG: hypothetical protein Kow00108_08320 [Calditrichia bacterium]